MIHNARKDTVEEWTQNV